MSQPRYSPGIITSSLIEGATPGSPGKSVIAIWTRKNPGEIRGKGRLNPDIVAN